MPKAFERCVKSEGRIRTVKRGEGKYQHICFQSGKSYAGEVKRRKKSAGKIMKRRKGR